MFSIREKRRFVNHCLFTEQQFQKIFQMFVFLLYKTTKIEYDISVPQNQPITWIEKQGGK